MNRLALFVVVGLAAAGCERKSAPAPSATPSVIAVSSVAPSPSATPPAASSLPPAPSGPCKVESSNGLAGVTVKVWSDRCALRVGEGGTFHYEITTTDAVPVLDVEATPACGDCTQYTSDPLSWIVWSISGKDVHGKRNVYSDHDRGCCAPHDAKSIKVQSTRRQGLITWSGRTWRGPSDTAQKEGPPFGPGDYVVTVTFARRVRAELPITVR